MPFSSHAWRSLFFLLVGFIGGFFAAAVFLINRPAAPPLIEPAQETVVLPAAVSTKIILGDAIPKLAAAGAIDVKKFEALYASRGGLSPEQRALLTTPSTQPLRITRDNAQFLVNLLWPLGLANQSPVLAASPMAAPDAVGRFASTGGWTLGVDPNGASYFNRFPILALTDAQAQQVRRVAENIFRPCCDNPTSFPDCNHGTALLGVLQLGARQGLSDKELFAEALTFQMFWFPGQYQQIAQFFQDARGKDFRAVDPAVILSAEYSSVSGFRKNIPTPQRSGGGCSA